MASLKKKSLSEASNSSALTPALRDTCVRLMRVDKDVFQEVHGFLQVNSGMSRTDEREKKHGSLFGNSAMSAEPSVPSLPHEISSTYLLSPGGEIAAALLLSRLILTFEQRHSNQPAATLPAATTPPPPPQKESKKANPPPRNIPEASGAIIVPTAPEPPVGASITTPNVILNLTAASTSPNRFSKQSPIFSNDKGFAGTIPPARLKLSPNVVRCLSHAATDLGLVYEVLPPRLATWSVIQIVGYVMNWLQASRTELEGTLAQKDATGWIRKLHLLWDKVLPSGDHDKFHFFATQVLAWMSNRIVATLEAYYDFCFIWDRVIAPRPSLVRLLESLNLSPYIAGLDDERDEDSDDDGPWSPSQLERVQLLVWMFSCAGAASLQSRDISSDTPVSRRQRLVLSAAAILLFVSLPCLSPTNDMDDPVVLDEVVIEIPIESNGENSLEPSESKKRKLLDNPAQRAVDAILTHAISGAKMDLWRAVLDTVNVEAAFTRWATVGPRKMGQDVDSDELMSQIEFLQLHLVAGFNNVLSSPPPMTQIFSGTEQDPPPMSNSLFLKNLRVSFPRPRALIWYLPTILNVFYEKAVLHIFQRGKVRVESVAYLDEASLIENSRSNGTLEHLCPRLDRVVNEEEHQFTAVAAQDRSTYTDAPAMMEAKLSDSLILPRFVTPTTVTDSMELNEWSVSLLCLDVVKPSTKLSVLLEESIRSPDSKQAWPDIVLPVLNKTLLRLTKENLAEKRSRVAPVVVAMQPEAGVFQVQGDLTADKELCKAVTALYYHALEAILYNESKRLNTKAHPRLVMDDVFHRSILACCINATIHAVGATQKLQPSPSLQGLQVFAIMQMTDINPAEYVKISESFVRALTTDTARGHLGSPLIFALPALVRKYMQATELKILDSLIWVRDPKFEDTFPDQIEELKEKSRKGDVCLWPPQVLAPVLKEELYDLTQGETKKPIYPSTEHSDYTDYKTASYIVRKILKISFHRIQIICKELAIPSILPIVTQIWVTFRYFLRNNVHLLYDRHLDHWILCAVYGITKTVRYKPEITFARIIDAYVTVRGRELGDVTCQRIVRHIKVNPDKAATEVGNVILLYNRIFVPSMKAHLLKSKSLKVRTSEIVKVLEMDVEAPPRKSQKTSATMSQSPTPHALLHFGKMDAKALLTANEASSWISVDKGSPPIIAAEAHGNKKEPEDSREIRLHS
jgi:hypothetical protein